MEEALLYEKIAGDIADSITREALRPGDRLPSVRTLSVERGVSVATVLSAYGELERLGLVESRPKSGHFVRRRGPSVAEPRAARRTSAAVRVSSVSDAVAALQASMRDPSVVALGSAYLAPELLPMEAINRLAASIAREVRLVGANYDPPPGLLALRRQLARRAVDWGLALTEDDFLVTIGGTEALSLALGAVTKPGDAVAVESPTYFGILQILEQLGLRAVEVPAQPRTGMDLDALGDALRAGPIRAVVAVTTGSNPLGAIMPDESRERLVRMLARHDIPLIEDDVYGDLVFDGARPRPASAFDREGRVLLCGSTSKTLAPGLRVGWLVAGRYEAQVRRRQYALTLACASLPQMTVAEYLASGAYDRHLRRLRTHVAAQVARIRDEVARVFPEGTRVTDPRAGFVVWVELPPGTNALEVAAKALAKGVAVAPGPMFSARGRFTHALRLSCGMPWSPALERAIHTVAAIAAKG
jgi:DNA-binding transcriptional MocR family regulator